MQFLMALNRLIVGGSAKITGELTVGGVAATPVAGVARSIVQRDANGYINNTWFNSNRADEASAAASYIYDTGDGYMRKKTLANVRAELGRSGSFAHTASLANEAQLVGDYTGQTTANKMIWAMGSNYNTWATHYGLGYEYGLLNGVNSHQLTFRGEGATFARISLDNGNASFTGSLNVGGKNIYT